MVFHDWDARFPSVFSNKMSSGSSGRDAGQEVHQRVGLSGSLKKTCFCRLTFLEKNKFMVTKGESGGQIEF